MLLGALWCCDVLFTRFCARETLPSEKLESPEAEVFSNGNCFVQSFFSEGSEQDNNAKVK